MKAAMSTAEIPALIFMISSGVAGGLYSDFAMWQCPPGKTGAHKIMSWFLRPDHQAAPGLYNKKLSSWF
jgi:hypothetical protein